jgi:hypothetical protein
LIKIVFAGSNQAYPPKIKNLRTLAVRWWFQWKITLIFIEMR